MDHAFLPPSGASAWSKCAMWPTMNAKFPQDDSAHTIEGTAAHWVAWEIFMSRKPLISAQTPNATLVTDEMLEGGQLLVDTIHEQAAGIDYSAVETKLSMSGLHEKIFGTPDWFGVSLT